MATYIFLNLIWNAFTGLHVDTLPNKVGQSETRFGNCLFYSLFQKVAFKIEGSMGDCYNASAFIFTHRLSAVTLTF